MSDKLELIPLRLSHTYAQAIHTALFYLIDNLEKLDLENVTDVNTFEKSELNKQYLSDIFNFILSEFNYEISYMQMCKAVNILLIYIKSGKLNQLKTK